MKVVVVGGHTRNIGKTSVMAALIRQFAPLGWTAVKITQYGHGVCSHNGHACECAPEEHPFALTEERDPASRSDTSRYLAAGARRSLWLRARQGQLGAALPLLTRRLTRAGWVVIESNSVLEFIDPLLYLVVLDPSRADFKASAERWLGRANALIPVDNRNQHSGIEAQQGNGAVAWAKMGAVDTEVFRSKPSFPVRPPEYWSAGLTAFVRERLEQPSEERTRAVVQQAGTRRRPLVEETWQH